MRSHGKKHVFEHLHRKQHSTHYMCVIMRPVKHPACVLLRPDSEEAKKKARLEKLAAWKRQQEQQQQQQQSVFDAPADDEEDVPASTGNDAKVW